ncbi:hypothetical protein CC78DRAFT_38794 [Lojkania enalia]|uniref:Uncharacterized protein n=1 Tax=Lojkania enalia TaxID=147567 RepID=A0A9P4K643_9PLEO|nr:hypothetical protein CC78DRAFT_38794 [Didymosphaeria enalia]
MRLFSIGIREQDPPSLQDAMTFCVASLPHNKWIRHLFWGYRLALIQQSPQHYPESETLFGVATCLDRSP